MPKELSGQLTYAHSTHHNVDELFQSGDTPLHLAAMKGHTTCVECFVSTPGIDVNINNKVSNCCVRYTYMYIYMHMCMYI